MFDIPTNPNIEKCTITKETVVNKKPPILTIGESRKEKAKQKNSSVKKKKAGEENNKAG